MQVTWTPTGGSLVVLGDDFNALSTGLIRTKLEQLGGVGVEQLERLAFAAAAFRQMRGNVSGDCVFTARKSHASRDTAANYFKTNFGYVGQVGVLQITFDSATFTMANGTFRGLVVAEFNGLEWALKYTFGMTTIA